jgi:nucleoside-diphosphate-sugar epimerase
VRELPVPIPGDGTQLVSLTNSQDVASILISPLNHIQSATEQRIFNCGTDQLVSYNDVALMCGRIAGVENVNIEHYDADLFGKTEFPFRTTNFYVDPAMAKQVLEYPGPDNTLEADLVWYYENYKERGGPAMKMSFIKDWEICVGCKTAPQGYVTSIYDKYDPIVIDTSNVKN